jgi:hypothetical protein
MTGRDEMLLKNNPPKAASRIQVWLQYDINFYLAQTKKEPHTNKKEEWKIQTRP